MLSLASRKSPSSKFITLAVVILAAFALRLFYLNARGIWYDEALSILYASRSFSEILAGTLTPVGGAAADVHPLFYFFSLHYWLELAGDSVFSARYYSVFYGIATIPLIYRLADEWFGASVALLSAIILALAPFHLAYSQEVRMYAQLGFWSALTFLAFVRHQRGAAKKWWMLFVFGGAGMLYSHNLAFIALGALGVWVAVDALRTRTTRILVSTALAGLAMTALWLPWLVNVPSQFGKIEQAFWVPPPTIATLLQTFVVFAFDFENAAFPQGLFPILLFSAILIMALVIFALARERQKNLAFFPVTMMVLPVIFLFALSQVRSVYIIRGLMPAFLWYVILVAFMLTRMPRPIRLALAVALVAITAATLPAYYSYADFPRAPFAQTDRALRARVEPGDAIVHDNKLSFLPMHYYDRSFPQSFIADPPGAGSDTLALPTQQALGLFASTLQDATANKSRIWFVIFREALDQAEQEGHPQPNQAWLNANFKQVSLMQFNDLNVYLFQK